MLNALAALFLYILIAKVIVLAAIRIGISIWWLRQASSVIPWMSLARLASIAMLAQRLRECSQPIDLLISNAGAAHRGCYHVGL